MDHSNLFLELSCSNHWLPLAHGQFIYRHNFAVTLTIHKRVVKVTVTNKLLARRSIDTLEIRYHGNNQEYPELEGRLLWIGHLFFRI